MNYRALAALMLIMPAALALTTGTLNFSVRDVAITTGLFAYTVNTCSNNAQCFGYSCFLDYDTVGTRTNASGLCNATYIKTCIHDTSSSVFSMTPNGEYYCLNNITYRQCNLGNWSIEGSCTGGQICGGGTTSCTSTSTSTTTTTTTTTTTSNTTKTNTTNTTTRSLKVSGQASFDIQAGKNSSVKFTAKNNGNVNLTGVRITTALNSVWYSVVPTGADIGVGQSQEYTIRISIPEDTETGTYTADVTAADLIGTASTASFMLNVLPGDADKIDINSTYIGILSTLDNLEKTYNEKKSYLVKEDAEAVRVLLINARAKIKQINSSISSNDYFNAKIFLDEAQSIVVAAQQQMTNAKSLPIDLGFWAGVIILFVALIAVVAYLFWPVKEDKKHFLMKRFGWK